MQLCVSFSGRGRDGFTSLAPPSSRVAAGSLECLATPPTPEPAVASQIIHHLLPPRAADDEVAPIARSLGGGRVSPSTV